MDALVADAHLPNAVAGIRGLGRAGVRVHALGPGRGAAGCWSRYAAGRGFGPLADAVARHAPVVVYPGQEATVDDLLRLPGGAGATLPWDPASLVPLRAKDDLPRLAAAHGLSAPRTLFEGTAAELPGAGVALPAVVKPAGPVGALATARAVRSRAELDDLAAGLPAATPLIAQERVDGTLVSLALVIHRGGGVVARFQEEARGTWPREAGSFAATVSVAPDEDLVDRARSLLAGAGYWGLAQLDLVRRRDATLLLDVNPRFYACMPLALACGLNLPALWHSVVEGDAPAAPRDYPLGRRYRWLEGDTYAARHGEPRALVPRGGRADAGTMWAADDPVASVLLAAAALTKPLRRRLGAAA